MRFIQPALPDSPAWDQVTETIRRNNSERNVFISADDARIIRGALALELSLTSDQEDIQKINRLLYTMSSIIESEQ